MKLELMTDMPRLALPVTLAAAAFCAGWWLAPKSSATRLPPPALQSPAGSAPLPGHAGATALDRRTAKLMRLQVADPDSIRRLLESDTLATPEVIRLTERWAKSHPASLWQWIQAGGRNHLGDFKVTDQLFAGWLGKDQKSALLAYRQIGDPSEKNLAAKGMLALLLGATFPAKEPLISHINELVDGVHGCVDELFLDGKSVPETVSKLMALPASRGRDKLLSDTAHLWVQQDWRASSHWASNLPEPLKSKVLAPLLSRIFQAAANPSPALAAQSSSCADPACLGWATQFLQTSASREIRHRLGPQFVAILAQKDPGAALAWAQDNLSAQPLSTAMKSALEGISRQDPARARAIIEELPPGSIKEKAAFAVAGTASPETAEWLLGQVDLKAGGWATFGSDLAFFDPEAFRDFLATRDRSTLPEYLVKEGVDRLTQMNAPATLAWANSQQSPGLVSAVMQSWGRQNGPAAAAWIKDHPAVAWDTESVNKVAAGYLFRESKAAIDWATALPSGPVRQAALTSLQNGIPQLPNLSQEERNTLQERLTERP